MNLLVRFKRKINPFILIAFSFLILIFIGSLILYSPLALKDGVKVSYIDSLFTATTSLCVTGLVSIKEGISATYSTFGKVIICLLIQIGGLGVMTFVTFFFVALKRKLKASEQNIIKENWNLSSLKTIRKIFFLILIATLSIELMGAILCFFSFYFIHGFELDAAIGYSIFHSVSSFNNAGIDIIGNNSLIDFSKDYYLLIVTSILIILGGIGYFVLLEVINKKFKFKSFSLHTKVALVYSLFLILFGTIVFYVTELFNEYSSLDFINAYFLSVSSRTAGFSSINLKTFNYATLIIVCVFMFIGASSGGSGGGVKVTTFAIFIAYIRSLFTGKAPHMFKRNINDNLIKKSLVLIIMGFSLFLVGFIIITAVEGNTVYINNNESYDTFIEGSVEYSSLDYAFEAMSAYGTVGFSTGITPYLGVVSKIVLIILMYIGRVGPLTISIMFKPKESSLFRYVSEDISVG